MNGEKIYNSIKNGSVSVESLDTRQNEILFAYLCTLIENGEITDESILSCCEKKVSCSVNENPNKIIKKVYSLLYGKRHAMQKAIKHIVAASLSAAAMAALCFGTAYAFDVDVVGSIHTIISADYTVIYEKHDQNRGQSISKKYSASYVFEKQFPEYIRPSYYPEGVKPTKIVKNKETENRIYTLFLNDDEGEYGQIFASSAEQSYLPMGYKFTAEYENANLDFIYTVSHGSGGVTGYKLYTVYRDIQYTFYFDTDNWSQIKIILENLIIP